MSDDFGLVDCSIAPLLWRLKSLDFDLAENNKVIGDYSERIFEREAFQDSLTETEKELFNFIFNLILSSKRYRDMIKCVICTVIYT